MTAVLNQVTTGLAGTSLNPARLQVQVSLGAEPAGLVDVDLHYRFDIITPLIQELVPGGITLHARSAMRVE